MSAPHPSRLEPAPKVPLWKYISTAPLQTPTWQERLEQLAVQGRAYFPSPRDFNDPFDCIPHLPIPTTAAGMRANVRHLADRMLQALAEDYPAEFLRSRLAASVDLADPGGVARVIAESIGCTTERIGVFCLSEAIDSVLMWSHYASNHQGFALRFDPGLRFDEQLPAALFKVHYQEERPSLRLFDPGDAPGELTDALATKASFWGYEREWRGLWPDNARQFAKFDPAAVTAIAFGVKCSEQTRAEVHGIMAGRQVEYLQASAGTETFELRLVPAS